MFYLILIILLGFISLVGIEMAVRYALAALLLVVGCFLVALGVTIITVL